MAEPTVNQFVATTLNNYHKQFADNVSNSNAVTALLREGNRVRVIEGGRAIACPLTYAEETFAWYVGTELLSRATKETISEAHYDPANAVACVTLSGPDLAKNRSRERILNLLEGKLDNAEATMKNNITKAVYGDGTVAKSFAGLKSIVTPDGLGLVGGIDATTWTFWKNQFQVVARATGLQYPALKAGDERALDEADPRCREARSDRRRRRNLRHLRERPAGEPALRRRQARGPRLRNPEIQVARRWCSTARRRVSPGPTTSTPST